MFFADNRILSGIFFLIYMEACLDLSCFGKYVYEGVVELRLLSWMKMMFGAAWMNG